MRFKVFWTVLPFIVGAAPLISIYYMKTSNPPKMALSIYQKDSYDDYVKVYDPSVLQDPDGLIHHDFHPPERLEPRVKFWFDIYTRYSSMDYLIHHRDYPWIILARIDARQFLNQRTPRWTAQSKAARQAQLRLRGIRSQLARLAKNPQEIRSEADRDVLEHLSQIFGDKKEILREASRSIRIQQGQMDSFVETLRRAPRFFPMMEAEFVKMGLPKELTRIPMIESSMQESIRSPAGASGLWQIMPVTGHPYLLISPTIDERNSPLKATRAAGRILKNYYSSLKRWDLTVSAYNHGIGTVQNAMKNKRTRDLASMIDHHQSPIYGFYSQNYYSCFLAALFAEVYQDRIFRPIEGQAPARREVYRLTQDISLHELPDLTGVSTKEILKYNRDIQPKSAQWVQIPKGFELHLPIRAKNPMGQPKPVVSHIGSLRQTQAQLEQKPKSSTR